MEYENWICVAGLRSIQCIIIKHVLAAARDEICKVVDVHTCAAHLWSMVWPWLNYGLWKVMFCVGLCSIPRIIIKHLLVAARDEICNIIDLHIFCCTSMKRSLALVKLWMMKSDCFCWSSFDTSYHHKTRSGGCQGWNMQSLRFIYLFLTLNVLQFHR